MKMTRHREIKGKDKQRIKGREKCEPKFPDAQNMKGFALPKNRKTEIKINR